MGDERLADLWRKAAFGAEQADDRPFDPFAANVLLSAVDSLKLAGLEAMGAPVLRRLTSASRDDPDGERARQSRMDFMILDLLARQHKWDAQLVTVGGVRMTNAEAQAARHRILDNPDHYVAWAKKRGLIGDGEEDAFLETVRRLRELNELERNGKLMSTQRAEREALQGSRLGRAADEATGQAHLDAGWALEASAEQTGRTVDGTVAAEYMDDLAGRIDQQLPQQQAQARGVCPVDEPAIAHTVPLTPCFAAALDATEPLDRPATDTAPEDARPAPDHAVATSGFDF